MANIKGYNMPDELYYHEEHSWARVEDGKVTVGSNSSSSSGRSTNTISPDEEDEVEQNEVCGKIQSRKWIGKLCAPVSGEIVEINEDLEDDTSFINEDPYGKGWILVIEPSDLESELGNLMHGDALIPFVDQEIKRTEEERAKA